jgi:hypothetical protein
VSERVMLARRPLAIVVVASLCGMPRRAATSSNTDSISPCDSACVAMNRPNRNAARFSRVLLADRRL